MMMMPFILAGMLGRSLISRAPKPSAKIVDLAPKPSAKIVDQPRLWTNYNDREYDGKMSMVLLRQGLPLKSFTMMTTSLSFSCLANFQPGDVNKFLANLDLNSHLKYSPLSSALALLISDEEATSKQPTETAVQEWEEVSIDDVVNDNFQLRGK